MRALLPTVLLALVWACALLPSGHRELQGSGTREHEVVLPPGGSTGLEGGEHSTLARLKLHVLGVAQDGGVPHLGCRRECCEAARQEGLRLGPACLAVVNHASRKSLLIEATPAMEEQLALLPDPGDPRRPVEGILLTHAHIGHYAGLIQLGREVASASSIPVHCTPRMAGFLRDNGPWSQLVKLGQIQLEDQAPGDARSLPGFKDLKITPIAVPHRDEFSDTVAWRIEGPARTVVFCPDIDRWEEDLLARLIEGADVCYLDATFYDGRELPGRDLSEIPHPPMVVTMDRLAKEALEQPGRFRFIHLNHTNPALRDPAIRAEVVGRGFAIAEVGESVLLD